MQTMKWSSMEIEQNTCSKLYLAGWNRRSENKEYQEIAHMNNGASVEYSREQELSYQPRDPERNTRARNLKKARTKSPSGNVVMKRKVTAANQRRNSQSSRNCQK